MNNRDAFYRIEIVTEAGEVPETSADIRLFYVVDGGLFVKKEGSPYSLAKSDLILIGSEEPTEIAKKGSDIKESENTDQRFMLAVLSIDYFRLCSLQDTFVLKFYVNSQDDTGYKYTQLREQMQNLLMAYVAQEAAGSYKETGYFYLILNTLLEHFTAQQSGSDSGQDRSEQVMKILHYIHMNYAENLGLNEVAEHLYLSVSSVSRLFQKVTGEKFSVYVKNMRMTHVKRDLEETDHSITKIAVDNGFSTPSALNKIFKAEFGVTPTEYREKRSEMRRESVQDEGKKEKLFHILQESQRLREEERIGRNLVCVDASQFEQWKRWENRLLDVGPAHTLASANMQKQVLFLAHKLDIEYVRIWNLFSPRMMIGKAPYNFTFVDEILDFCVDNRLKVFLDLSQRRVVSLASEKKAIFSSDERTDFESEKEWADVMDAFLLHIRRRYHERVVGGWIFEFTFYLNDKPYYKSSGYSNRKVWGKGYQLVKERIPSARVAGPGIVATTSQELMRSEVQKFLSSEYPPDLFTAMIFPYLHEGESEPGFVYRESYKKIANRDFIREQSMILREILRQESYDGEYWITDWGSSLANRSYIQDSCFRGTFIVENFLKNNESAASMGIFYASDLLEAYSDTNSVLSGSAGLLSRSGICKPAYYAYRFLDKLGRYRLAGSDNCVVTEEHPGDLRILCFNNKALGPRYYLSEEDATKPEEMGKLFVNTDPLNMEFRIRFPENRAAYTIRQRILNAGKGSVLNKWIDFGCSTKLSRGDMEYLGKTSTPEIVMERKESMDNELRLTLTLEPNEIRLITIMRE